MDEFEANMKVLGDIAQRYPRDSVEYSALQTASKAVLFIWQREIGEQFLSYLHTCDLPLTPLQREHLRELGLIKGEGENPENPGTHTDFGGIGKWTSKRGRS